jgi:alpha-L-fucosidase
VWESLFQHNEAPEWFRDAKLGIYFHWGVYSVPAFSSEWYPRNMHRKDHAAHKHHVETYGDPSEFGYHDFVSMFKAEFFNADEWADLFQKAGARFAGPVAEHHDGFSMWASKLTPWNAKERGPGRDIVGEMAKAVRARGMRFITTFHHAFNNQYPIRRYPTGYYPHVQGWSTASDDPELRLMYGNMPRDEFLEFWKGKLFEVIDGYRPDIIWFDFVLDNIPEETRMEFLAYYFNKAREWNKEVVVTFKGEDLPGEVGVEDFEKGRLDHLSDTPWLTDDTISWGSWCYTRDLEIKSIQTVLHTFIDIVSKNGVLLLNVSPKADGTIPVNQQDVLYELGDWLKVNGEAIYDTRPWKTFGQGPTRLEKGGHFVDHVDYTSEDVRFTRSKDGKILYAICMGWPETALNLDLVQVQKSGKNASVTLLGMRKPLKYHLTEDKTIMIQVPDMPEETRPCRYAYVFKLTGFELSVHPDVVFMGTSAVTLDAEKATLAGERIGFEKKSGNQTNIGFWNDSDESAHWLAWIQTPGRYAVRGRFATMHAGSGLTVECLKQSLSCDVPNTGDWNAAVDVRFKGDLTFDTPGVYHIVLRPADPETWKAVNVWHLQLGRME